MSIVPKLESIDNKLDNLESIDDKLDKLLDLQYLRVSSKPLREKQKIYRRGKDGKQTNIIDTLHDFPVDISEKISNKYLKMNSNEISKIGSDTSRGLSIVFIYKNKRREGYNSIGRFLNYDIVKEMSRSQRERGYSIDFIELDKDEKIEEIIVFPRTDMQAELIDPYWRDRKPNDQLWVRHFIFKTNKNKKGYNIPEKLSGVVESAHKKFTVDEDKYFTGFVIKDARIVDIVQEEYQLKGSKKTRKKRRNKKGRNKKKTKKNKSRKRSNKKKKKSKK